jgi:hypothetical protein
MQFLEGWDAAEGMLKGGAGREVAVDVILLLIRRALGQGADDVLDVVGCRKSC